jgi:hypothetical protein
MSHATVVVRITAARLASCGGDLDTAIAVMMAPFDEQTEDACFLEFEDQEDEHRDQYETKTTEQVLMPDGSWKWPWDANISGGTQVTRTFKEAYATFEAFCKDYHHQAAPDEKTGRYGYWRNPNKTWDWFQIGGRWRGFFPVKAGARVHIGKAGAFNNQPDAYDGCESSDVARASDIDMDAVAKKTRQEAEGFFDEYEKLLANPLDKKLHDWGGPRSRALDLGLIDVVRGPALSGKSADGKETITAPWSKLHPSIDEERRSWTDVIEVLDRAAFLAKYEHCFCPISAYAALRDEDASGVATPTWHAPGKMGRFGSSSGTPEDYVAFKKGFVESFIKGGDPADTLVLVDYHI